MMFLGWELRPTGERIHGYYRNTKGNCFASDPKDDDNPCEYISLQQHEGDKLREALRLNKKQRLVPRYQ